MNIWALKKDVSIKSMLMMLVEHLGEEAFVVVDDVPMDHRSVRVANPLDEVITACITSYADCRGRYQVALEYPALMEISVGEQVDSYPNVNFDQLVAMVSAHLDLGV